MKEKPTSPAYFKKMKEERRKAKEIGDWIIRLINESKISAPTAHYIVSSVLVDLVLSTPTPHTEEAHLAILQNDVNFITEAIKEYHSQRTQTGN